MRLILEGQIEERDPRRGQPTGREIRFERSKEARHSETAASVRIIVLEPRCPPVAVDLPDFEFEQLVEQFYAAYRAEQGRV